MMAAEQLLIKVPGRQNRPTNLSEDRGQETTITWTNTLNYNKKIGKHSFNVLLGSEFITNYGSSIGATRARYSNTDPAFQYIDFGALSAGSLEWWRRIAMGVVLFFWFSKL